MSPAVSGKLTPEDGLKALLAHTGLTYQYLNERTVAIRRESVGPQASKNSAGGVEDGDRRLAQSVPGGPSDTGGPDEQHGYDAKKEAGSAEGVVRLEQVIVTGTHIRNAEPVSPVITMTHEELVSQGYTRLDDAIAQLPQNFGATSQISNSIINNVPGSGYNQTFGSSVDLRGLGAGTTLTLLNGRRLPTNVNGLSVDISSIPLSAIDRVEIMTDGASAIYGSDAIGGVINIITVKSFSGLQLDLKSTGISAGKTPNNQENLTGGLNWASGNVLATVGFEKDSPLMTDARSFTATTPGPTDLSPQQEATNVYIGLHQHITDAVDLSADLLASRRRYFANSNNFGYSATVSGKADQITPSLQLDVSLGPAWQLSLVGQLAQEKDFVFNNEITYQVTESDHYTNFMPSVEGRLNGELFKLPGGSVRTALGATFRQERFEYGSDQAPSIDQQRHVSSEYLELLVPLVSETNRVPLVKELQLDLAGRRDDYSDFGSASTPKFSARWKMTDELDWHGSFARSFKAAHAV